jgi:hypothetical protein
VHFEVLAEDASGERLLAAVLPKIPGEQGLLHTWRIHPYKGIGRIPRDLRGTTDPWKRVLLDRLPKILAGYGHSLQGSDSAVVVVVDLDDRDCLAFKEELLQIERACNPKPRVLFRIAIEEMEAWLLGDKHAVLAEYPKAKTRVLDAYIPDSICGAWEALAGAVYPGGSAALKAESYQVTGAEKCKWAERIGERLDIWANLSPSFHAFRDGLLKTCRQKENPFARSL